MLLSKLKSILKNKKKNTYYNKNHSEHRVFISRVKEEHPILYVDDYDDYIDDYDYIDYD